MNVRQLTLSLPGTSPPGFQLEQGISSFHTWIRDDVLSEIVPIDVGDYRHLADRPRVLLVAHTGVLSLQRGRGGGIALSWGRRRDAVGTLAVRLPEGLAVLLRAATHLEDGLGLRFDRRSVGVEVTSRWVQADPDRLRAGVGDALADHGVASVVARPGRGPVAVIASLERPLGR